MNTKIVYVLVSSDKDIYLEQAWVSIYSMKWFNEDASVTLVCDEETNHIIVSGRYQEFKRLLDEIIPIEFDKIITNKIRSRWLKTNLRNIVNGDFLFVDTDTIITGDLSSIDQCHDDVNMVLDLHCNFIDHPFRSLIEKKIKRLFDVCLKSSTDYYNSGVIFSKDTEKSHMFFNKWHQCWLSGKDKKGGAEDQQSLAVTNNELCIVKPLSGEYNCQILGSIEFLHTAKIVHFFNTQWWSGGNLSPFWGKEFYEDLKVSRRITPDIKDKILNCRSSFVSPSMLVGVKDMQLWLTPTFKLIRNLYLRHTRIFAALNMISKIWLKTKRIGSKMIG